MDHMREVEGEIMGIKDPNIKNMSVLKNVFIEPKEEALKSQEEWDEKEQGEIDEKVIENDDPWSNEFTTLNIPLFISINC